MHFTYEIIKISQDRDALRFSRELTRPQRQRRQLGMVGFSHNTAKPIVDCCVANGVAARIVRLAVVIILMGLRLIYSAAAMSVATGT